MKKILGLVTVFLALVAGGRAEVPSIRFDGETYHLVWIDVSKSGAVTNEYVRTGETVEAWTTLVAVRHWPEAKFGDAAGAWLKMIGPLLTKKVEAFKSDVAKSADDLVFEAWISAPDRSYIEPNLYRFVVEAGVPGVKSYQFAEKIVMTGGRGDPTMFAKRRNGRFGELAKMEVAVHLTKGDVARPEANTAIGNSMAQVPGVAEMGPDLSAEDAIIGAKQNEGGIKGRFVMVVRAREQKGTVTLLKSESDQRSPTCLTIVISSQAWAQWSAVLGRSALAKVEGKKLRVSGVARRESVLRKTVNAMKTESYYRTQIEIESPDQIEVIEP